MWLISRMIAFFATFVALIGLALFIGHMQPMSPQIHAWRLDECAKPCWMGITPGQSTVPEAYGQVSAVLENFGYSLEPLQSTWSEYGVNLHVRDSSGHADPDMNITIAGKAKVVTQFGVGRGRLDAIMPTLGDFVSLFGPPACVSSLPGANALILVIYFNDAEDNPILYVVMDAFTFSWTQPVYAFSMGQSATPSVNNSCAPQSKAVSWHGLRSADYYYVP